jgi:uncharacterized repeat protein (TIGR03803 family)
MGAVVGALLLPLPQARGDVGLVTLHCFGAGVDGSTPNGLVMGADGSLYGTTQGGGGYQSGTVFEMSTSGDLTILAGFNSIADGSMPAAPLTPGKNGAFYGSTENDGLYFKGTLFKIDAGGTFTTLAAFDGTNNGANPIGPLVLGGDGSLYGTASWGGAGGMGTVFKLSAEGTLTALVAFDGTNGAQPHGGLALGADGLLYGTTEGYNSCNGTAFKASTSGQLTTLCSFGNPGNGYFPIGGLTQGTDGNWYGTTQAGGTNTQDPYGVGYGTVFQVTPSGALTTLVSFNGANGWSPQAGLVQGSDGNFYGTTAQGGDSLTPAFGSTGAGTIFKVTPGGLLTDLYSFTGGADGGTPVSGLVEGADGDFYGTTTAGGGTNGGGTAYRLTFSAPPRPPSILIQPASQTNGAGTAATFWVSATGEDPMGYRWQVDGASLTDRAEVSGAASSTLTIANVTSADAGTYSVIVSNVAGTVTSAVAALTVLYPAASLNIIYSFPAPFGGASGQGSEPVNALVQASNGRLYGSTACLTGESEGGGVIFELTTNGQLAALDMLGAKQYTFQGGPFCLGLLGGSLAQGGDGNLYGVTTASLELAGGGTPFNPGGAIFKVAPDGSLTVLAHFADGSVPTGALTEGRDGNFYGMAQVGVQGGGDTIFRVTPGGELTTLYTFSGGSDGGSPSGGLVLGADAALYGTTSSGGLDGSGTAFRITTSGALTTLYFFTGDDGGPSGVVQGPDGNLYGTTASPASQAASGAVFRLDAKGTLTNLYRFTGGNDGSCPGPVVWGADGALYGATASGGPYGFGTLFKITTNGVFNILNWFPFEQNFANNPGAPPALVQGRDGTFYGVTSGGGPFGGGTAFQLILSATRPFFFTLPGDQAVLPGATACFSASAGGLWPLTYRWQKGPVNLVDGGRISGAETGCLIISNVVSADEGAYALTLSNQLGSVTSPVALLTVIMPAAPMHVLYSFSVPAETSGIVPWGGITLGSGGSLYGTTLFSAALAGGGTIFRLGSNGALTTLYPFGEITNANGIALDGSQPMGELVQGQDGAFYGTTAMGGPLNAGTVFAITTNGVLTTLASFDGTNGAMPMAGLTLGTDGSLYGTTIGGGPGYVPDTGQTNQPVGYGTVFKISPSGALTTLVALNGTNGAYPEGPLTLGTNGALYGTTSQGSDSFYGAGNPANWMQSLTSLGGTITTAPDGYGTVFQISPNGAFSTLASFHATNGAVPVGALALGTDGSLYGTVLASGSQLTNNNGAIFKLSPQGTLALLYSFTGGMDGSMPFGGLVSGLDQDLYGTTMYGGEYGKGTVFKVATNGTFTSLYSFTGGLDGYYPTDTLIQAPDGAFYGTCPMGGSGMGGTVFQLTFTPAPPSAPLLSIARTNHQVWLSWPITATGYVLEASSKLSAGVEWTPLTNKPLSLGESFVLTNGASLPSSFFRLCQP